MADVDMQGASDDSLDCPLCSQHDFRIVQIDVEDSHKLALKLAQRNFEFMPRDILQYISKWEQPGT